MNDIFSKDYIQKAIKDQIKTRQISAINAYIRNLIPKYKLTNEMMDKISELIQEEKK